MCYFWINTSNQVKESLTVLKKKHSDPMGSQRKSWRVLRVATISLWGILLMVRGDFELANAPTQAYYHRIDAAYDCSMYHQLSNTFCPAQVNKLQHAVPVQQGYIKLYPTTENTIHP